MLVKVKQKPIKDKKDMNLLTCNQTQTVTLLKKFFLTNLLPFALLFSLLSDNAKPFTNMFISFFLLLLIPT